MTILIRITSTYIDDQHGSIIPMINFKQDINLILNKQCIKRFIKSKTSLSLYDLHDVDFDYVFGHGFDNHRFIDIIIHINEDYYCIQEKALETFVHKYIHKSNFKFSKLQSH